MRLPPLKSLAERQWQIDGGGLRGLDSAATLLLLERLRAAGVAPERLQWVNFTASHRRIVGGVLAYSRAAAQALPRSRPRLLALVGQSAESLVLRLRDQIAFFGLTIAAIAEAVRHPSRFRPRECFAQLQQAGLSAIPVVALVMFLIGTVMAYLLGIQAEQYGANVYVVDGVTLGTVREFAPLLVAIVVAGRSGAAFTAQLGTMKLTGEIDAIRTLGMSPGQVLLLPRVLALVVALPLLVFVGSVAALVGAALVCEWMLGIAPATFIERMHAAIGMRHYFIGLLKAPVFALVIAIIGCSMGFAVSRDTRSIGISTTSTVVQCIVAVILLDAAFAVVFQEIGW